MDEMGFTAWYDHPVANSYPRKNGKAWTWLAYDEFSSQSTLKRGDRVRIRDEYYNGDNADIYYYLGKNPENDDMVMLSAEYLGDHCRLVLAAAIEPYPYSREERIERAIEDFIAFTEWTVPLSADDAALLFAILDAGV
jgi:hypothetical protein